SSLHASQEESVRLDELAFWSEFLNQRSDGWPEHPEAGSDQSIHQVELPDLHTMSKRQHSNAHDNHSAHGIEPHNQAPAIFAVNQDAGEGKHEHGGKRLQNRERAESHFR